MSTDDEDRDEHDRLPVARRAEAPLAPSPPIPPLTAPTTTGFFSRWRVDQDSAMLRSLNERQKLATAFVEENGRTADAMHRTQEKVALLHDLDAIRANARATAADQREEAAHQRRMAALRRQEELAQQEHRTNVARFGERVFRETEPEREKIRKDAVKRHEHEVATAVNDAEAKALAAQALKNNAAAERVMSDRDLAAISAPVTPAAAMPAPPSSFSIETVFQTIDAHAKEARTRSDQPTIDALNNLAARLLSHNSYAPGTALNLTQVLNIIADEIDKAVARNAYAAVAALYRLREALSPAR